jgi:hypothetical protein
VHVAPAHAPLSHTKLAQSSAALHFLPLPHCEQKPPPQSASDSTPFCTPSLHAGA